MRRHDDHFHPEPSPPAEPYGESAGQEHRPGGPEDVPGDAAIERRHGSDSRYTGPERRLARR